MPRNKAATIGVSRETSRGRRVELQSGVRVMMQLDLLFVRRIAAGSADSSLFADAEVRENFAEQVGGGEFAGNASKRILCKPELLGQ